MKSKKEDEMSVDYAEENKRLKELLKEALPALCDFRVLRGRCAACNTMHCCLSRKLIPKIEKELKLR